VIVCMRMVVRGMFGPNLSLPQNVITIKRVMYTA
jgi:hypothetical protein